MLNRKFYILSLTVGEVYIRELLALIDGKEERGGIKCGYL